MSNNIDTERLDHVLEAEHHLFLLKSAIWGCADPRTQHGHLVEVLKALVPLKVEVYGGKASREN